MRRSIAIPMLLLLASCTRTSMAPSTPPTSWASDLAGYRAAKDEAFRFGDDSPLGPAARASFRGLEYWDPDPRHYLTGFMTPIDPPEPATIVTTGGVERPCEKVGRITFRLPGGEGALTVYRLLDQERVEGGAGLFLPFMDATTGKETYGAGRYVELDGPEGGPYVLDFNRAYSPLCAYGMPERYRCPATPKENKLSFRVEAGERGWTGR